MNRRLKLASSGLLAMFAVAAVLYFALPAQSYLSLYTGTSADRWDITAFPVTYNINTSVSSNVSGGSSAAVSMIDRSFATWNSAPNSAIQVSNAGTSSITSSGFDGVNLICFVCQGDFTQDSSTLAVTMTWTADAPGQDTKHGQSAQFAGQIIDSDILFNPNVQWATTSAPTGSQQSLQTVATHEIGHFLGLDHSGVVRAIMYPYAPDELITLSYDDVAGLSLIYPKSTPDFATGSIQGTVKFANGGGVFGAHVFADSTSGSSSVWPNVRKSTIGALTTADGTYMIRGLPADSYTVGAEPLDEPVTNGDIEDYAKQAGKSSVQTNFNTRWH